MKETMFETEYRAFKRGCDRQNWYYGFRYYNGDEWYILESGHVPPSYHQPGGDYQTARIPVKPESISRCTDFTDVKGELVYQNDFVKVHGFIFVGIEIEVEWEGMVVWIQEDPYSGGPLGAWGLKLTKADHYFNHTGFDKNNPSKADAVPFMELVGLHEESLEIIGNRFTNPELYEKIKDSESPQSG